MNLWQTFEVRQDTSYINNGISFHYQKGIDEELRKCFFSFADWLRKTYVFPTHINVYILNCEKVCLKSGRMAYGSFCWSENKPPLIKVPSAVEAELLTEYSLEQVYEQILSSLVHELTHYYQWVLGLEQNNATSERQANYFRYRIIEKYYSDRVCH